MSDDEGTGLSFLDDTAAAAERVPSAKLAVAVAASGLPFRRPSGPAPKSMTTGQRQQWDAAVGEWVEAEGYTAAAAVLSDAWIQTRLSQTLIHLEKLASDGGMHGSAMLRRHELAEARTELIAALAGVKGDPRGWKQEATASSVFWAIALAQNAAARRVDGWVVDDDDSVEAWSMDTLHRWLTEFRGEGHSTNENGEGPATLIAAGGRGRGRGAASFRGALDQERKRRRLRVDALGDAAQRKEKMRVLHRLIREGGGSGLVDAVIDLEPPSVRTLALPPAAAEGGWMPAGRGTRAAMVARWGRGGTAPASAAPKGAPPQPPPFPAHPTATVAAPPPIDSSTQLALPPTTAPEHGGVAAFPHHLDVPESASTNSGSCSVRSSMQQPRDQEQDVTDDGDEEDLLALIGA
jgi:hypothetical protein